jgi:hypothetical protein
VPRKLSWFSSLRKVRAAKLIKGIILTLDLSNKILGSTTLANRCPLISSINGLKLKLSLAPSNPRRRAKKKQKVTLNGLRNLTKCRNNVDWTKTSKAKSRRQTGNETPPELTIPQNLKLYISSIRLSKNNAIKIKRLIPTHAHNQTSMGSRT